MANVNVHSPNVACIGAKHRKRHAAVAPRQHNNTTKVKNPRQNWKNRLKQKMTFLIIIIGTRYNNAVHRTHTIKYVNR